jgi:hypothetical protein
MTTTRNHPWKRTFLAFALACAGGCGGGSGGTPPPPDPLDVAPPQVALSFPPADATTDRETIVVDGKASDDVGVVDVAVNGVAATSDDGFRTWRAEVPLARGANSLLVEARDAAGNTASAAGAVERGDPAFIDPTGVAIDATRGRALVVDRSRLLSVDLATGERAEVALSGVALANARRIVVDDAGRFAYVSGAGRVLRVEIGTGVTILLSEQVASPSGIRLDPATGTLVTNDPFGGTYRIDLTTGVAVAVMAEYLRGPPDFVLDRARNRVVSAVAGTPTAFGFVAAWDLDTGARISLSHQLRGTGPDPTRLGVVLVQGQALDEANELLYSVDEETGLVFEWQLATGDRRILSGAGAGTGPPLLQPRAMVLDAPRGRLLVADAGAGALMAVDLATGDRAVMSGTARGQGPSLLGIRDVAAATDGRLFAVRTIETATTSLFYPILTRREPVLVIDGADRSALPAPAGVLLAMPRAIAIDETSGRLLVADAGGLVSVFDTATGYWALVDRPPALLGIDPFTGAATVISDATRGSGPMFVEPDRIALDGGDVLVMDVASKALFRVDPATGDRSVLSNRLVGDGAEFQTLSGLDLDLPTARAIVSDGLLGIVSVDVATGDRTGVAALTGGSDLTVDVFGRRAFLAGATTLHTIDLDAGDTRTVSGGGPAMLNPRAVLYDVARDVVLVGDPGTASIVAVSPRTGERVIVAK